MSLQLAPQAPLDVINAYFEAMRAGATQVDALIALFAEDAIYTEPFGGTERTHEGRDAVASCLRSGVQNAPPDMTLEVNRIDVDGETVVSAWTCRSPVFPGPMRGVDTCTVRDGKIHRLEVKFL